MTRSTPNADGPRHKADKPESPDKARWMLWLPHETLAALRAESAETGEPMAAIVRSVADARAGLPLANVAAYTAEAERRGVEVSEVYRDALVSGTPGEEQAAA